MVATMIRAAEESRIKEPKREDLHPFEGAAPILEHGKTGWVVENRNIHAFAASVIHLLEDTELARELGENAKTYVTSNFNWDMTAQKTEEVYHGLLRQGVRA